VKPKRMEIPQNIAKKIRKLAHKLHAKGSERTSSAMPKILKLQKIAVRIKQRWPKLGWEEIIQFLEHAPDSYEQVFDTAKKIRQKYLDRIQGRK